MPNNMKVAFYLPRGNGRQVMMAKTGNLLTFIVMRIPENKSLFHGIA